jgi:hypothetical protein
MLWRPLITFEDFTKVKKDFDQIPTVYVSYASSYFALLQCNLVEHLIVDIWEDLDTLRFFSAWGIPSLSYIKSSGSHTTTVQTFLMEGQSPHPVLTSR